MNSSPQSSFSASVRPGPALFSLGLFLGLIQWGILWGTQVPLGIPDQWTWTRSGLSVADLWNLWPAVLMGVPLWLFVVGFGFRCEQVSRRVLGAGLLVLWVSGALWSLSVVASIPGIAGLSRVPFVLYYTRSSGYYTQARNDVDNLHQFLSTYHERIADSSVPENYLHMGTHPPGLTVAIVGIIHLCERVPAVRDLLLATQPGAVRESFEVVSSLTTGDSRPMQPTDEAALWLAALLVIGLASGTCLPLYLLARRTVSRTAAWWSACFWLLVPSVFIFFPKSDVLFPCLAMWIQWLWLTGMDRRSFWFGAAAGGLLFLAINLTLAFAPIGLMLVLQGIAVPWWHSSARTAPRGQLRKFISDSLRVNVGAVVAFGVLLGLARWLGGINLIRIWLQNLKNHAAFYQHATRDYFPWLLENPLELAFSLGLPLALLAGAGCVLLVWGAVRTDALRASPERSLPRSGSLDLLIPVAVWGLLWISGKNMGEAARLWVFLMPYALWLAALTIEQLADRSDRRWLAGLFLVQMGVCIGTVLQIDGFQFADLMAG